VVCVKQAEHTLILFRWNGDAEVVESLSELVEVESLSVVIVHNLENTHDTINASSTSRNNLVPDGFYQFLISEWFVVIGGLVVLCVALVGWNIGLRADVSRFAQLLPVSNAGSLHGSLYFGLLINVLPLCSNILCMVLHWRIVELSKQTLVHVHLPILFCVLPVDVRVLAGNLDGGVLAVGFYNVHVPDADQEQLVVVVVGDDGTEELVVLEELVEADGPVRGEVLGDSVVRLEEVVELEPGLLEGLLAALDLRVAGGVELLLDLVELEGAVAVGVEFAEGLGGEPDSLLGEGPEDGVHELLEGNAPVSVHVEDSEHALALLRGRLQLVVCARALELVEVQGPVSVRVHYLELPLQPDQALHASVEHLLLEALQLVLLLLRLRVLRMRLHQLVFGLVRLYVLLVSALERRGHVQLVRLLP